MANPLWNKNDLACFKLALQLKNAGIHREVGKTPSYFASAPTEINNSGTMQQK